jgi:hypothetical protein
MKPVKTEMGQRVLKDRSVQLTPRQRAAFILFDGRNTVDQVLAATSSVGVTRDDVEHLLQLGLLEVPARAAPAVAAPAPAAPPTGVAPEATAAPAASDRNAQQRYQDAYPIATKLTASLGLRGFRLNLAVEHAGNYEELRELAPRIREAVGDKAFADLERALSA